MSDDVKEIYRYMLSKRLRDHEFRLEYAKEYLRMYMLPKDK